jgi:hypothetical protein
MEFKKIHIAIEWQKINQINLYIVLYLAVCAINGGFTVYPDPFRGTKRQTRWVHNGPGTRENAARIDDRYAKKQYHRAFKANAAAPVPDSTVVVPYDSRPAPYGTAFVPYDSRPAPYGTASVPYDSRPVSYGTASVPYDSRPVPYGTASVPYDSRPAPYGTASVPYDSRSVPYGTASVPYASRPVPYGAASVSDNSVLVAGILIPMRYCKNNFNTI